MILDSRRTGGSAPVHISFSTDVSILHVRGLGLDSISDVGDSLDEILDEGCIDRCENLIPRQYTKFENP